MEDNAGAFTPAEAETWTLADAKAADAAWRAAGKPGGRSPLRTWYVLHQELPSLRERWGPPPEDRQPKIKELRALWQAVAECGRHGIPPPGWLTRAASNLGDDRRTNSAGNHMPAVWAVIDLRDQGIDVDEACWQVSLRAWCQITDERLRSLYFKHIRDMPVTEELRGDGWWWRKPTGAPDSEYQQHRRFDDDN